MNFTCDAPDCLRPTRDGRTYCEAHQKRAKRGQSMSAPLDSARYARSGPDARTPEQRFLDAVLRFADASAEDDEEYRRAKWNLDDAGRRHYGRASGRPPTIDTSRVVALWWELRSVRAIANQLGRSRDSVRRALARGGVKRGGGKHPTGPRGRKTRED